MHALRDYENVSSTFGFKYLFGSSPLGYHQNALFLRVSSSITA